MPVLDTNIMEAQLVIRLINCGALKGRVQSLIRNRWLKIEGHGMAPSVSINPLPNYDTGKGGNVNMVKSMDEDLVYEVEQLNPYFEEIFKFAVVSKP